MAITREQMVAALRAEVGTRGGSSYWKELGYGSSWYNKSWCCVYASVMLIRAGFDFGRDGLNCGYGSGGIQNNLKAIGAYQIDPRNAQPGDALIFDFYQDGNFDHIGFVTINRGTYLQTIEGNVSNTVGERVRQFADIRQCWHIPYATEVKDGWIKKDSKYYYYKDGKLVKNQWAKGTGDWSGSYFYIGKAGYAVTNEWHKYNGTYYYCGAKGWPVSNEWAEAKGAWYWMGDDCKPVFNRVAEHDGKYYFLDTDGAKPIKGDIIYT